MRVSLFFINRLIEQGDTSLSLSFSLPLSVSLFGCFISSSSFCLFLRFLRFLPPLAGPASLSIPLSPVCFVLVPPTDFPFTFFRTLCFSFSSAPPIVLTLLSPAETTALVTARRTLCHPVPGQSFSFFSFLLFYSTFSQVGGILLLPERATPVFSGQ